MVREGAATCPLRERFEIPGSGAKPDAFLEQVSAENILQTLKVLEVKIINNKLATPLCQKVTDIIIKYLRTVKPEQDLEEKCTAVLLAIGSHFPRMIIEKLWDRVHLYNLPPRSLLVAIGKLSGCPGGRLPSLEQGFFSHSPPGTAHCIGTTWEHVLRLLRLAQEEEDMLAICQVLNGLVLSARKHLDLGASADEVMDITQEAVSIKAYHTLRVLFNRWPMKSKGKVAEQTLVIIGHLFFLIAPSKLKNQVNQLIRWLMTMSNNVTPFYISQLNIRVNSADSYSVQNSLLVLRTFSVLTKLYNDQVVLLIRKTMESKDPALVESALHVFMDLFLEVPQSEKLRNEIMHSTIVMVQKDLKPVRKALLSFIEMLGRHDYLSLPQSNSILDYIIIKLCESEYSVPLPRLVTIMCEPSNLFAFVPLSKTVVEMAQKAQAQGQAPYLSNFHLTPTQFVTPQNLLTCLVMLSLKPYKEKDIGVSALKLLHALHPITSLHPIINSDVGQLWKQEIPKMVEFLDDHNEKTLIQEKWEKWLLKFSSRSLVAMNDDKWLKYLISVILKRINYFSEAHEKTFLYKFFGFSLWTSTDKKLVQIMLSSLLQTTHEDLEEREGIAVAVSIVATRHMKVVLDQLQVYCTVLTDQDSSYILQMPKEHQQREWGLVCRTLYLCYSKIISASKTVIYHHMDAILTLIPLHYYNCIVEKDMNLKLDYLDALTVLTNNLSSYPMAFQFEFPHKPDIVAFMVELIKEEPMTAVSSFIRQKAMNIITDFGMLRPLIDVEEKSDLLRICFKSVLCLPPVESLQKEESGSLESQFNVNMFKETLQALRKMMEALIIEMPTRTQHCLELLDTWMNSQRDHERERAMWCTACILGYIAKLKDFDKKIEFSRLGRLVRLLAMRCQDPVENICFLSAQAVYNLYCILLRQKHLGRKKEGLWEEEGKSGIYSANVFFNSTFEIAKAFAEYFTKAQVTNLVLTALEGLTDSRAKVSLAVAQLMSAVLKERGKDVMKIEEVMDGILSRLNSQLEPSTKEETLQAMCWLASSNTLTVVSMLLSKPLPWNRTNLSVWKAFGTLRESTISVLLLLISILEKLHPREEASELDVQPVAVACALCEMLSGSLCQEAIRELYPRLLLAVLYHLHWVIEQDTPQKMVVYAKEGYLGSKNKAYDPTSCALEVVRLVILAAAYEGVVNYADNHSCWSLLSSPMFYYMGIVDLTSHLVSLSLLSRVHRSLATSSRPLLASCVPPSGIVKTCEPAVLHRILNLVRNLLYSPDNYWMILARAFYAQLLWHRSVAQTLGQDFLGNLSRWIKEPNLIMKEIGLRGISNLALHPQQSEALKSLVPLLRSLLRSEVRVAVQAVKSLRNIICHGKGVDVKVVFCSIARQLRPLINDERDQVRIVATSSLGHMLRQVSKFKSGSTVRREIYTFLVPLLLSIQDTNTEVVKACGGALTEWTKVIVWSSLTEIFRHTTLSDHIHVLEETCKYLLKL
ncbi:PREDICTED: maestro heat-like repeat-containing protein family member 1 [Condylura cristata]|uniref:maestro heat-like repeat-containing protein family member 1 n=1 Tax=Condylura cristata TaxID=143302 RepID=UPI00064368BA|nr:PREDICTED: maestro heat-like repeat-containing protein family member 1 [Condylura cristata]